MGFLVNGILFVAFLGLCKTDCCWNLGVQGLQEGYCWRCMDCHDFCSCHCQEVSRRFDITLSSPFFLSFALREMLTKFLYFLLFFLSRSSLQSSSLHLILYPSRPSTSSMPYTTLLPLELVLVTRDRYSLLPQPRSTLPGPLQTIHHPLLFHDYFDVPRLSSNQSPTLDSKELDLNFGENIPSASDPLRPTLFTSPLPETEFLQAPKTIAPNLTSPTSLVATIRQATYAVNSLAVYSSSSAHPL